MKKEDVLIQQFPLFEVLNETERKRLLRMVEYQIKPKYSYIYHADELAHTVFFLAEGSIKIGTHSSDGKEIIKSILHPFAMFGELCVVDENKRQDFAQVISKNVHLYALQISDLKQLMQDNFQLCTRLLSLIGNRLVQAENKLEGFVFKDARTRIVDFIKDSAQKRGRQVGYETLYKHSLTQQDIANITGTSRQTVTSVFNELKKSNLIYFNRNSILVRDMSNLA